MVFSENELSQFTAFAERLADAARAQTLPRFRSGAVIFDKEGPSFDPVTDADREAELALRRLIESEYPAHGVLGEEFGETKCSGPWRWVLDPVDGTRAFMCGAPSWTTLIALEYDGEPVLGVIDQPFTDERWVGSRGRTLYRRGDASKMATTSGLRDLAKARLSTTDPQAGECFSEEEAAAFARLAQSSRVARFSLDAYAYGLLAIGELDLVMESALKRYDYAALVPLIKGAGGAVSNWKGEAAGSDERGELIAAATPELLAAALQTLAG